MSIDAKTHAGEPGGTEWFSDGDRIVTELRRGRHERDAAPHIPGYERLERLGRGGQGVVFAATQRSTHRRVAIKVLLDGAFASASARRRFEREVEIAASLQHPGIVRLFDSGTTEDGRLYTVMELIEGQSLDRWAAAHPASAATDRAAWIRERAGLAAAIGDAVHAAHQRGIIHRDLKPGNVRVDDAGRPHVLDFGLAKPLDGTSMHASATVSRSGHFLGSVPWASPEQANGSAAGADVRSDVYSLGVVAYQLLTESMPYDASGSIGEALRAVVEAPPAPPRLLGRPIGRDLETVLLKALAKDPARRYQSAGEFVADLRRALRGEAIDARRDSGWYLLRMAARRHRAAIGGAALLLVLIVAGAAGMTWAWRVAESERTLAERRADDARGLARALLFDTHDAIAELPGSRPARERMVATAMDYLERLAQESGGDPSLELEIAEGRERIGDMLGNPSVPNLGDTAAALREYRSALERVTPLLGIPASAGAGGGSIDDPVAGRSAESVVDSGEQDPNTVRARRQAVSLLNRIGAVLTSQGDRDGALDHHRRALALMASESIGLSPRERTAIEAATHMRIGEALAWKQDGERALLEFEVAASRLESLAADEAATDRDRHNLQVCLSKVGFMQGQLGRGDDALRTQKRALVISLALSQAEPTNAARRRSVEINHNQVGAMLLRLGRPDEAIEHFLSALGIAESLAMADPANRQAQSDLAFTLNKVGEAIWERSAAEALPRFESALAIRRALAEADSANAEHQRGHAVACIKVGDANLRLAAEGAADRRDRAARAREHYERAISMLEAMGSAGTLAEVDRGLPDQIRESVAECDALLAAPGGSAAPADAAGPGA